jgi:hypothetical protein
MIEDKNAQQGCFKKTVLFIIGVMIFQFIIMMVIYYAFRETSSKVQKIDQRSGTRTGFSPFYYADSGLWVINDPSIDVLRDRKYISPSERDAYLVREIGNGVEVRIIQVHQRWKEVEVMVGDNIVAKGWIDANNVREACRKESKDH